VGESQEALFYLNGACVGVLQAGSHVLETENIPFLKKLFNKVTGNVNIFHAQIYYVNKVELDMKWGVGDIMYEDPAGPVFTMGCHGQMNLMAVNSRMLVEKLVGNQSGLTKAQVIEKFRMLLAAEITDRLVNVMMERDISITQVTGKQLIISESLKPILFELFQGYGFSLEQFRIVRIAVPEDDPEFRRLKRLRANEGLRKRELELEQAEALIRTKTEGEQTMIRAQAEAEAYRMQALAEAEGMKAKGYTYQQETARQVGLAAMQNGITGNGSGLGDIAGLGITLGAMGSVAGMTKEALNPALSGWNVSEPATPPTPAAAPPAPVTIQPAAKAPASDSWDCSCGQKGITSKFCPECGGKRPEAPSAWNCSCGQTGITSKFCPECGSKRPEAPATWNCACGVTGITSKFCPECGAKRGE
jgi:hypothetical protein